MPWAYVVFLVLFMFGFHRFCMNALGTVFESWSTHYALTDRRFMVVSNRGLVDYGPERFAAMTPAKPGANVLTFDSGARIAGLEDAAVLERLIRQTLATNIELGAPHA